MSYELQYYGVRFLGINTVQFEQSPRRDDSGTDTWYDEFTVGISTVINTAVFAAQNQVLGVIGNRVQGGSASEVCRNLQARFEDRKPFSLIQDGTIVLASDVTTDADNGPKIVKAEFRPMGANSARITVVIRVSKVSCTENPSAVLGNRWQVIDEIDDHWRTTRTWRGKLRVCNSVQNPQAFRHLVIPQLSDGFQRVRMHFTGELNGLELSYEVVDRQLLGDAPPAPGVSMQGTHTETLNRNGAYSIGEVYVRLDGPPGTDKQILLEQCMKIINSKVQADRFAKNSDRWLWLELIVSDYFGQDVCAVDARARVQRAVKTEEQGGESLKLGNMLLETLGRPLDLGGEYVRYRIVPPEAYPCTTIGLFACHLQSPCVDDHAMPQAAARVDGGGESPGQDSEEPTYNITYDSSGSQLEIDSPGYDTGHTEAMYMTCSVEWIVRKNHGYIQLPYGDQLPKSNNTSATIRLHAPTAKLLMKVAAERMGDWPKIPKDSRFTDAAGIVYTPMKFDSNSRPPEYQGDGRKLHVIDIEAAFAMSRAPEPGEFVYPKLPWDDMPPGAIPQSSYASLDYS